MDKEVRHTFLSIIQHKECVVNELVTRKGLETAQLYVSEIRRGRFCLVDQVYNPTGAIILAETYHNSRDNEFYSRIYLNPTTNAIPTVCVGPLASIGQIGYKEELPINPYRQKPINVGGSVLSSDDLYSLPTSKFTPTDRLFYVTRPSSYILTDIWSSTGTGQQEKVKFFQDILDRKTFRFFCHITSPDEQTNIIPDHEVFGLSFTNCREYSQSHRELRWFVC